jgi:hypothetical protein
MVKNEIAKYKLLRIGEMARLVKRRKSGNKVYSVANYAPLDVMPMRRK